MKIAIFHELHIGGAKRAVNEFAKVLKKNHQVDLYTVDDAGGKDFFTNVFFYTFIPKKWSGGNWKIKLYKDTIELYKLYKLHKKIAQDINGKKYDVAFIHPSQFTQAPFILRFINTKKVYYCQEVLRMAYEPQFAIPSDISLPKKLYERGIRWMRRIIDKENISQADLILTNSKYTQENVRQVYGLKSTVSYLGVDTDVFRPLSTKKNADILFIGAKGEIDGYTMLEDAAKLMVKKPIIKTHITGKDWIDDNDLNKLYASAKIVVCLARNEPFGLISLEALACEVPVIAVDEGGYKETVVDKKTGYLVSRDAGVLGKSMEALLANEKERIRMGEYARKYILANWTWKKAVKSFESCLMYEKK
jgi:glycosyltransferase involved in cell wall biosynthesis